MNKTVFAAAAITALVLYGCTVNPALDFRLSEDGVYRLPDKEADAWARAIVRADDARAMELLDQGYSIADSLCKDDPDARTLDAFVLTVADRFLNLDSPYYNEHAYDMALEREARCENWTSWGRRGMDWRRSILNLNRAGTRVSDFWLSKGEHAKDTLLRQLLPGAPLTVLFLYGESCSTCRKMMGDIEKNRSFKRMAHEGSVQFVSLYTGENPEEYEAACLRLPSYWDNWYDRENVVMYSRAFDTRMIPSLYVIDNNQTVLLRGQTKVSETVKFLRSR